MEIKEGDNIVWAGWQIEYVRLVQRETADKLIAEVELRVGRGQGRPVSLTPARHLHPLQDQWTTEVAIHSTWAADLYVVLNAGLGDGRVALTFVENPCMRWIWVGAWLAAAGVLVSSWPTRKRGQVAGKESQVAAKVPPADLHLKRAA
jgi:cytochrome c-type biogenesis protein CcmF